MWRRPFKIQLFTARRVGQATVAETLWLDFFLLEAWGAVVLQALVSPNMGRQRHATLLLPTSILLLE